MKKGGEEGGMEKWTPGGGGIERHLNVNGGCFVHV